MKMKAGSNGRKHPRAVRRRAFSIWQELGYLPWSRPREEKSKNGRDFYKGAFDSIPFLNDDAKRTFAHLLLRPGYMIRDYIRGQHERYLAPLTALIVFYAFFALVSSLLQPAHDRHLNFEGDATLEADNPEGEKLLQNTLELFKKGYIYLHLDQYPEEVNTQGEASLAALEGTLRSQGIPLFISQFFFLWLAMSLALRRYNGEMSVWAAASAYVLCQFSFFMLFAVLLTWGKVSSLGLALMLVLLTVDLKQLLGVGYKTSLRLAIRTGVIYAAIYSVVILLLSGSLVLIAHLRG